MHGPYPWSQRRVALELRYAIDVARRRPTAEAIERVRHLIAAHRTAFESRHVQHNLGLLRQEWLKETIGETQS